MAALSHSSKGKTLLSRLKSFLAPERLKCSFVADEGRAHFSSDTGACSGSGQVEISKWRKIDSRNLGLRRSMISIPASVVLRNLRAAGFEAYLVGGCIRDLLLNKVPKDFDVITTASLKQVKKKFQRAIIVGKRFPICRVIIKGCLVEVSSFETVAVKSKSKQVDISEMPKGCNPRDFARWKNCMSRDFTVNSLFFDPAVNVIFDYTNAMADLRSLKLSTVIPAQRSFKEDEARILRGLRLAARLNLSFSKETEVALYSLSSLVANLSTSRIGLEMNNMLSYGAAEPSLLLLKRFNLLEILLPFHAAYISEQVDNQLGIRSLMLMVFVSQKMGQYVKNIFNILTRDVETIKAKERSGGIDYHLLKDGNICENRFVLGKIILRTLLYRNTAERGSVKAEEDDKMQVTNPPQKSVIKEIPQHSDKNVNEKRILKDNNHVKPNKVHENASALSSLFK
ncbi:PREDICTED: uncharacterized protein LOC105965731 [Erythranthe guttata]|uniref:uncharacterized protein LOC105965731 n=1 Tax=Erythranthe guttata TaxID=4155 RepID=UPI00064D9D32|nr:PREDICTED: uncharacterized protein LOC105965731 [Erythranthe guttata]|eukprot:XP_012845755.1 PREDICTED: uncharacterized protein LOC105965731 [Erythranthe guttata]